MPEKCQCVHHKTGGFGRMKEQDIMLKLTELLFQEELISPAEKIKLHHLIHSKEENYD